MRTFSVGEPVEVNFNGTYSLTEGTWMAGKVASLDIIADAYGVDPYQHWVPVHPEGGISIFLVPNAEPFIRRSADDGR